MKPLLAAVAALTACANSAGADAAYLQEVEQYRAEHVAKLTKPDGWLSLIGLHFLKEGPNSVGSAKDNDVVLAKGPARLGTITVSANGRITLEAAPPADVRVDGRSVPAAELKWDVPSTPTLVTAGTVSFFAIDRAGKKALRVRDSESPRRLRFPGLEYFPIDPAWRIVARWEPFEKLRMVPVVNILGQTEPTLVAGKASFAHAGTQVELIAIDEGPQAPLFFVISDATSGKETYGGGRHLYATRPREGERTIVLDFNRAENPPCALTPFSTCPVPPKENRLPFPIRAGEKTFRGHHE